MAIDYRWLAESVLMTSDLLAKDLCAAIDHACNVPGKMTATQVDRLVKLETAIEQARACLKVTPGHLELVSGVVPELEKRGRKAEADELFGVAWSAYTRVLADHPESASARNSLATLGANCRRELDKALRYAEEAVAADPVSVGYRETLAEVRFRRGERDEALAVMTGLSGENPRSRFYRRQLARYRSGDPASPLPDTADD